MEYKDAYAEIMRMYDRDRLECAHESERRREAAYREVPELEAIDEDIAGISIKVAKLILEKPEKQDQALAFMKQRHEANLKKRAELLKKSSLGPHCLDPVYKCQKCKDSGFIGSQKCSCFQARLIKLNYSSSNLETILRKENFSTFRLDVFSDKPYNPQAPKTESDPKDSSKKAADEPNELKDSPRANMQVVVETCKDFVNGFGQGKAARNLYLYGKAGAGKTFLCSCIAKAMLDKQYVVIYNTAPALFDMLGDARFGKNLDKIPSSLRSDMETCDLLILDDLGSEIVTSVSNSDLFAIINERVRLNKSTVISSNLSTKDLRSTYNDRVVSRILGSYTILELYGDDLRFVIKRGTEFPRHRR
jgi:DNA replication protein DnaC